MQKSSSAAVLRRLAIRIEVDIPELGILEGEVVAFNPGKPELGVLVTRQLPAKVAREIERRLSGERRGERRGAPGLRILG